ARGLGHVLVAEVRPAPGGFELVSVTVDPEHRWSTTPQRHVVKRVDGSTCPLCGRIASESGSWATARAGGSFKTGLDPVNCVGCWDTYATTGDAPIEFASDGSSTAIPRPE